MFLVVGSSTDSLLQSTLFSLIHQQLRVDYIFQELMMILFAYEKLELFIAEIVEGERPYWQPGNRKS